MSCIKIKTSKGDNVSIELENIDDALVSELKEKIESQMSVPAAEQRLIFGGHVLKDDKHLREYGIKHEHVVHMVRAASKSSSTVSPGAPQKPAAASPPAHAASPFGSPPAGANPMMGMDPALMQQMMESPMMDQLFSNPELMQQMMMANPQFRQIQERNPEMAAIFRDPAIMRQTLQAMRNPRLMQEMMRNADTAMQNIEMMPGGFDHLRRFYNDVQEPLLEGAAEQARQAAANPNPLAAMLGMGGAPQQGASSGQTSEQPAQPTQPGSGPLRNPWASSNNTSAGGAGSAAGANPFAALFGGAPAAAGASGGAAPNPLAGMFGGMGGAMGGADPAAAMQMMNNPFMRNVMQQMVSDPVMFEQMVRGNPMLRAMSASNPMLAQMTENPESMRQMMQLFLSLQPSGDAGGVGAVGFPDMSALLGLGSAPPASKPASAGPPSSGATTSPAAADGTSVPASPPFNFASLFSSLGVPPAPGQQPSAQPQLDLAALLGMLQPPAPAAAGGASPAAPRSPAPTMTREQLLTRYERELEQLHEMGFDNDDANLRVLQLTNGSVQLAVERLLSGR